MELGRGFIAGLVLPGGDGRLHAGMIRPETLGQCLEKGDARTGGERAVAAEDLARQGDARCLAAPGQKALAQFDQALGMRGSVAAPVARAIEQRTAAFGYCL